MLVWACVLSQGRWLMRMLAIVLGLAIAGCSSVELQPGDAQYNLDHVCIEENPDVLGKDFVAAVEGAFQERGISTELYSGDLPNHCSYKLTYTDLNPSQTGAELKHAEMRLYRGLNRISEAEYNSLDKAGDSSEIRLAHVKNGMTVAVDRLLAQNR